MKTVWIFIFLVLNVGLWPRPACSQGPHAFIATALEDPRCLAHRRMSAAIEASAGGLPYLDKIELRAGLDAVGYSEEQTYKLRFYPRPWGATRQQRRLVETVGRTNDVEQTFLLSEALKERYGLVLEYLEVKDLLDQNRALALVYEDWANVLRRKAAAGVGDDPADVVSAEEKRTGVRLEVMALTDRLDDLSERIHRLGGKEGPIDFAKEGIISLDRVLAMIRELPFQPEQSSIYLELLRHKVERADCDYALEKARSRDYLSYLEVGHTTGAEEDVPWEDQTSVEVGIRLPLGKPNAEKIWNRQYELSRERFDFEQEQAAAVNQYGRLLRATQNLAAQYRLVASSVRERGGDRLKTQSAMRGADPLIALALKKSMLETELRAIRLEFTIRSNFIQLMELNGRLTRKPIVDYLSERLEPLS